MPVYLAIGDILIDHYLILKTISKRSRIVKKLLKSHVTYLNPVCL